MGGNTGRVEAFWVLFSLSWFSSAALLSPTGVNFEVQALMGIKESLKDPHGVLKNWDQDAVDPCTWNMVSCSPQNFVVSLEIPSQNLSGSLSPSIGNLTNLQILQLQSNSIAGPIPLEIGKLLKLEQLDLSNNHFSGDVPKSIGNLKTLQYLRLNNNSLSGPFPQTLVDIPGLAFLDLSFNNLSGPIPKSPARSFNIVGNPLICPEGSEEGCYRSMPMPVSFDLNNSQVGGKRRNRNVAVGVGLGLSLTLVLGIGSGLYIWRRRRRSLQILFDTNYHQEEQVSPGNLRRFSFKELRVATNNFSRKNILGKGGFGNVYKGELRDGTLVAVKRLKDGNAAGGEKQFQTELEMISLAVHRNLLRLYGFCMTATERLLVYPYMSNGSVASRLKEKPALDWGTRRRIALGAARGLQYLHEQCDPKIIHRDVKAANVLLDDHCEAVVGDFGLAKLLDHRDTHVTTAVRGTVGHIAPEYLSTGQSSEKTDVFGFGILLLELVTGLTAMEFGKAANQKGALLEWVKKIQQERRLDTIVDKDLRNESGYGYDRVELEEMVRVALLCTQYLPARRPRMSEVVRMLEGDGLAERWEADASQPITNQHVSVSLVSFSDVTDDSSVMVQAMELSGPR
ncbi:hypothetical protein LUZ61_001949 [Rhynchospora tenuis]|uniref:non-specific serine/threonine protein kinase n=1 Tax=Rhynchospora tenuis TaxID=198213 RepID=A0AAD6ERB0_9POAL|nr:hypothetical protein LUZ61_001949 [Rhynchospora tenuis]